MAPSTVPSSDHTHMAGPAVRNMRTVNPAPAPTPIEPMRRRPRRSASRPPTTIPMPPGVLVRIWKAMIPPAEKPRSVRRYSFRNELAGSTNRASRNPAADSSASRRRSMVRSCVAPAEVRCRLRAGATNRSVSGMRRPRLSTIGIGQERHHVEDPPGAGADARPRLSSITAMPAPSAAVAVSTETAKAREPAGISSTAMMAMTRVSAVEKARARVWLTPSHARSGASAPVAVSSAAHHGREDEHPATSAPVGQGDDGQRQDRTDPGGGQHHADGPVADAEVLLEVGVGLAEQRAEVAAEHREDAQQGQRHRHAGVEVVGRRPPGMAGRRCGETGLAELAPHGQLEQEPPHRDGQAVGDRLGDRALAEVGVRAGPATRRGGSGGTGRIRA